MSSPFPVSGTFAHVAPPVPGVRLGQPLGQGGFATVYAGEQVSLGRPVAVRLRQPASTPVTAWDRTVNRLWRTPRRSRGSVMFLRTWARGWRDRADVVEADISAGSQDEEMTRHTHRPCGARAPSQRHTTPIKTAQTPSPTDLADPLAVGPTYLNSLTSCAGKPLAELLGDLALTPAKAVSPYDAADLPQMPSGPPGRETATRFVDLADAAVELAPWLSRADAIVLATAQPDSNENLLPGPYLLHRLGSEATLASVAAIGRATLFVALQVAQGWCAQGAFGHVAVVSMEQVVYPHDRTAGPSVDSLVIAEVSAHAEGGLTMEPVTVQRDTTMIGRRSLRLGGELQNIGPETPSSSHQMLLVLPRQADISRIDLVEVEDRLGYVCELRVTRG